MLTDRIFAHTKLFDKLWDDLGCDDDELSELQKQISENPTGTSCYQRYGRSKKIRVALEGRGKSGGARSYMEIFPNMA
jgi:hypothetical protein